jgi:hypothetical protein
MTAVKLAMTMSRDRTSAKILFAFMLISPYGNKFAYGRYALPILYIKIVALSRYFFELIVKNADLTGMRVCFRPLWVISYAKPQNLPFSYRTEIHPLSVYTQKQ